MTFRSKMPVVGIIIFAGFLLGTEDGSFNNHITIEPEKGDVGAVDLPITITAYDRIFFTQDVRITFHPATDITIKDLEPSDNVLTAKITIPPDTPPGIQVVNVDEDRWDYHGRGYFEVVVHEIISVQPDSNPAGDGFSVSITGRNTKFDNTSVVAFSGAGIQSGTATAVNDVLLELIIVVSPDAPRTLRDVTVTTGNAVATGQGLFTVLPPPMTITPSSATQGESLAAIAISGGPGGYSSSTTVDLGEGVGVNSISFPDSDSIILSDVTIAPNARVGSHDLVISNPLEIYSGAFTVIQGPDTRLLSMTPSQVDRGHPGQDVSFVGQNTNFDGNHLSLSFSSGGILVNDLVASDGEHLNAELRISDTTPEGTVDAVISLRTDDCDNCERVRLDGALEITSPGTLDSANPDAINAGESATVSFSATDGRFEDGQTVLVIEPRVGVAVTSLSVIDSNHLTAEIEVSPDAWGYPRNVRAVTGTEVAVGLELIDIYHPEIRTVVPNIAYQGDTLNITITGVDIPFDGSNQVVFSGSGIAVRWIRFDPEKPDQIDAHVSVEDDAPLGRRDMTVVAGDVEVTLQEALLVKSPPPPTDDGGCSCGGRSLTSLLFVLGVLGLLLLGRCRKFL